MQQCCARHLVLIFLQICRYNPEEVFINCRHHFYWNSICCSVWSYLDYEFHFRDLYCVHLNASVLFKRIKSQG
nr:putative nucleotide-sugar transporter [Ipomoea batatas]GMC76312.1 putative nucleotide-sugar transporter [Ipomoea batatas]GMC77175.1 putative nucleotide-sugar transporter [Ipomoea batatas]